MDACNCAKNNNWANKFKIYDSSKNRGVIGFVNEVKVYDANMYFGYLFYELGKKPLYNVYLETNRSTNYITQSRYIGDKTFYGVGNFN